MFEKGAYYYSVQDCFRNKRYTGSFKPDSLPASRVMKGTRIWRTINLDEGPNKAVFNSNRECQEIGLFEIIKFGLLEKDLNAFASDNFDEAAKSRLGQAEIGRAITWRDTSVTVSFDAAGNETRERSNETRTLMGDDIKSYLLKEDWVLNSHSGQLEKYIVGIAPLYYNTAEGKVLPLFWLYYPEWKSLFASFEAKNYYSYEAASYYTVFERRYFISQINKESNVFDRGVKAGSHGADIHLQSELIKEKLRNSESDLFGH